jgi:hypothetical protein
MQKGWGRRFRNYGKFKDTVYKHTPLTGNTKKYQLFYSSDEEPGILYAKTSSMDTTTHRMDLRRGADREETLKYFDINDIEVLEEKDRGIKKIKQVELFTKWRKHVPDEFKSPLYDNPGEEILQSVKDDRKSKKEYVESQMYKTTTGG